MGNSENDELTDLEERVMDMWGSNGDPAEYTHHIKGVLHHPPEKDGLLRKLFRTHDG